LAADFTGQGVSVPDGDTIEVLNSKRLARIRFNGIDCQATRAI
jgi:endonuclease YncB( thermonuclease family)